MEPSGESLIEVTLILLVHVPAISRAKSPPACRIDSDTANGVHRIIVKGIWRSSGNVHRRTHFTDKLEVLVNRKVKPNAR